MSKDQFKPIKQCILIAETLSSDYKNPSVFQKIGSIPNIELVISWLSEHGVSEIFLCHTNEKQQLKEYYEGIQKYCDSKLQLLFMHPDTLKNFGQVMRNVQFRGVINEEFLIVHGDTVTNMDLSKAISTHIKKKKELKNVVMTTVMRQGGEDNCIHLTNSETSQILQINQDDGEKFKLNTDHIKLKKMNVELRRDLSYCDIYICAIDVLNSFKQIQDYSTMFDYIEAMLTSDVFDQKIVAYTLEGSENCYRTNTAKGCYLAHMNYICRHLYPYTLFNRAKFPKWIKSEEVTYFASPFNKVLSNSAVLSRTVSVSSNCYIGCNTQIGQNVIVNKSVIGNNCVIQENTSIKNCIIMDGCFIEKGEKYENCLIEFANQIQHVQAFSFSSFKGFLVERPLFLQTPSIQQEQPSSGVPSIVPKTGQEPTNVLETELQNMMDTQPELEIVTELYIVRKRLNKTLQEFTKQMLKVKNPKSKQAMEQFVKQWGQIILVLHDKNQKSLIDSLYFSCKHLPTFEKVFHVLLQYFYAQELVQNFNTIEWYEEKRKKCPECITLERCVNFVEYLKNEEDEDSDEEDDKNSDD